MGEAFGLYTHIRNNRWRSGILIAGLFLLVTATTLALTLIIEAQAGGGRFEAILGQVAGRMPLCLPLAFAATALWVVIAFKANAVMIAWASEAQPLAREQSPRLYRLLEPLCISRGMALPRLMVMESEALNAFASGVNAEQFTITVTRGLLDELDDGELEAVLAHELTHIRNGDVKLMIVAILIVGVVSFFGEMAVRGGTRFSTLQVTHRGGDAGDRRGSGAGLAVIAGIAILMVAWFLGVLIRFSLSRSREYLADAGAVELTKNPDALISALLKISGRADIDGIPSGIMDMCIENDPNDFGDIFATHPSISKRIQALQAYAGGVLPLRQPLAPPLLRQRQPLPEIVEQHGPWGRHAASPLPEGVEQRGPWGRHAAPP